MLGSIFLGLFIVIVMIGIIRLCLKPRYNLKDIILDLFLIDLLIDLLSVMIENIDLD